MFFCGSQYMIHIRPLRIRRPYRIFSFGKSHCAIDQFNKYFNACILSMNVRRFMVV